MTSTNKEINADDFVSNGFVAGMLRGVHSSGIALIDTVSATPAVAKLPVSGMYFVGDHYASQLIKGASDANSIAICHTRAATQGEISMANAHPFTITNEDNEGFYTRELVGVHNGTLTGWKNRKDAKGYDVDSQWGLSHIFSQGAKAFDDIDGAYCFVWWDSDEPNILNIVRNSQRPMYVAHTAAGGMAFASEAGMLSWLLDRNQVKWAGEILQLAEDVWYKFDTTGDMTKPEKTAVTGTKVYGYNNTYSHNYKHHFDKVEELLAKVSKPATITHTEAREQERLQLQLEHDKLGADSKPQGKEFVTREEQQTAREMALIAVRGNFFPAMLDTASGILYGTFSASDAEWDAMIRDANGVHFAIGDDFEVSVLGVEDDGENLSLICSKPRVRVGASNAKQEETVH